MGGMGQKKVEEYRFPRKRGLARVREVIDFAQFLAKQLGFKVSVDGLDIQEIKDGVHLKGKAGGGGTHAWYAEAFTGEGGTLYFRLEPGSYNEVPPDLGGSPLTLSNNTGVLGTGEKHLYLDVDYTLHAANSFVHSATFNGAEVSVKSSLVTNPLGPNASGQYSILLASFVDGVKEGQYKDRSLGGEVCGVADTSAEANLLVHSS
jgi:hypothetical protein